MIVSLGFGAFDGLRLCSQARSHERTRNLPLLIIADPDDRPKVLRGLELGVNDYLTRRSTETSSWLGSGPTSARSVTRIDCASRCNNR